MSVKKRGASLLVGVGAITALVATAGAAHAADPVDPGALDPGLTTVNLLNINDFHGRIDDDNTGELGKSFACTVLSTRAALGADSTALLSAGDSIGASSFTSSSQEDGPTISFLNALGLEATAVGNHEFDRGFSDLTGRVDQLADFDQLGANVYERGTTTPALPGVRGHRGQRAAGRRHRRGHPADPLARLPAGGGRSRLRRPGRGGQPRRCTAQGR
uniref:Uncharacterized protein n=1 Tax=Janibacter limosus TaxID=53458 RepID=A0AC61U4X8_9MICO|nr:hypothetical protein [Janibacter limosus]